MAIKFEPLKKHIGAIIHADKSKLREPSVGRELMELLEDRGVLVFPKLGLTDEEQLALTDSLGNRVNFSKNAPGGTGAAAQDVYKVTLDAEFNPDHPEYVQGTFFWHMDGVTSDIPPPKATLLTARKVSATGGVTEFASTFAAYENLPEWEKELVEGKICVHNIINSMRPVIEYPNEEDLKRWRIASVVKKHPIVWKQKSGRKSLIVGTHADYIEGMPVPDGRAIMARLLEWVGQREFVYQHKWQVGDLVLWNNLGTVHRVTPYDKTSGRVMHRTSLAGNEHTL